MGFIEFCIKGRWWLLVGGFLLASTGVGIILIVLSIIGFVKKGKTNSGKIYSLPSSFDYPKEMKVKHFLKCPVCKKGKIEQDSEKQNLNICQNCNAQFKEKDELEYQLSVKNSGEEYQDYPYNNCNFSVYEWNTIAMSGKTLRENTLEKFKKGEVPNLSDMQIDSPVILTSKEHFIWSESSQLHEPRAIRNHKGASIRVAKGAYIHLGQSESHQEMRHIDNGILTLTNKKLVFNGGQRSSNIELKRIMNIYVYSDGFKVNIENRQKPQFFKVPDGEFWAALTTGAMKKIN